MRQGVTVLVVAALLPVGVAGAAAGDTTRVSVSSSGAEPNSRSGDRTALSRSARYVAFDSFATNLVPGDTNDSGDVFVRDRKKRKTKRVSIGTGGVEGNSYSGVPAISGDGAIVAFHSAASNLVANDTNGMIDVFVRDREARVTSRVSVGTGGTQGNFQSLDAALSYDGRFVAFTSGADTLVPGDTNLAGDVFVRDRAAGTTTRVSVATGGAQANEGSFYPAISSDGRFVVFYSWATNLVADDTNGAIDIFVHDRQTGQTRRASVATGGAQANADSNYPTISGDGRYVLFDSFATNLAPGDTNSTADVFLHDLTSGTTTRVSVADDESEGNSWSAVPEVSSDGRFVTFVSGASNLVVGDANGLEDIFVRDRIAGATIRVSRATDGSEANGLSEWPAASGNGRFFAFTSLASNLVQSDTNNVADVFLHDRGR